MILSKIVKKIYKKHLFRRYEERDNCFYFSSEDFEGINKTPFSFKNKRGNTLNGFFYEKKNLHNGRVVIFEHGMGSGHRAYMREIVLLAERGFLVYSYDRTGCASSEGEGAYGLSMSLSDLDDCINAFKADPVLNKLDISVVGHSWGGFSALNILKFHPEVSHIVAMSGFRSLRAMHEQILRGFLKRYSDDVFGVERDANPQYAEVSADETLKDTESKVLIIHSVDDNVVSYEKHFQYLKNSLKDNENVRFLSLDNKHHNPSYTENAVKQLSDYTSKLKKNSKKLKTPELRKKFVSSFDWYQITEQDDAVWNEIVALLEE